jgi:uncharacterized membrane protein YeaQ/YmgE (transglycosylase-associated protein family)
MVTESIGAACFGSVVGWVTYRTIRRKTQDVTLSDIAGVIGAVGGAAVTSLFGNVRLFAWYAIGLAAGFFLYLIVGSITGDKVPWLGD